MIASCKHCAELRGLLVSCRIFVMAHIVKCKQLGVEPVASRATLAEIDAVLSEAEDDTIPRAPRDATTC